VLGRFLAALAGLVLAIAPLDLLAGRAATWPEQSQQQAENEEVLANLATGQLEIYVGRDGVAIGLLGNAYEPQSHPPLLVQLKTGQVAILLGAVDWFYPASDRHVRLDASLLRLMATLSAGVPRLNAASGDDSAATGLMLLEPLRMLASSLHAPVGLPAETPLVEMVLLSYTRIEGARVSHLEYKWEQEPLRGNFWQTLVSRPELSELYPPARGNHGQSIELSYPPGLSPTIAGLLSKSDPRIAPSANRTAELSRVANNIQAGETQKARAADLAEFLRAALPAIQEPGTTAAVGMLNEKGFQWILPPPEAEQPAEPEAGGKPQPPGAPTLRKHPPE